MSWVVWLFRGTIAVLLCAGLNGCLPSGSGQTSGQREAHYLAGKSCLNNMDYRGAIEEFEKAAQANPNSAAAQFQLGWLYEEKEPDPAAAIYHYEQYLKLRPHSENASIIREHITNCKRDLARTVLPLPVSRDMQRQFEQVVEENRRLRQALGKWRTYADHLQVLLTNQEAAAPTHSTSVRPQPPERPAVPVPLTASARLESPRAKTVADRPAVASPPRTYVVKAGDSLYGIAKRNGIKLEALMAANPGLNPRRLLIGQVVKLPRP